MQESQEKWRRSCSRWTESDRRREQWSEFRVKAAGQWGRQKLIREAASFTTPQLDRLWACVCARVCMQAANQLALPVSESVFVWCVCVCIYPPCSTGHHTLPLLCSSIWLARPNQPHTNYHLCKATSSKQVSIVWQLANSTWGAGMLWCWAGLIMNSQLLLVSVRPAVIRGRGGDRNKSGRNSNWGWCWEAKLRWSIHAGPLMKRSISSPPAIHVVLMKTKSCV